jgi:universal stress protein E
MRDSVIAVIELDNFPNVVAKRAAWVARLYECDLHLLLSDPASGLLREEFLVSNETKEIGAAIVDSQQQYLAALCESLQADDGMTIAYSIRHDRPAHEAIIAEALDKEPRFIVKGTQYHSPAERATFTYTDWQLIRKLAMPLWLVKPYEWKERPVLVAAVDLMPADDEQGVLDQIIVDAGRSLVKKCNGSLLLLHTYQRLVEIGRYAMFEVKPVTLPIDELDQKIRDTHWQKLDAFAKANNIVADAVHQLPGRTSDILPGFARSHSADVVIMGALDRLRSKKRALGSTAERVMDHLHCDILVMPG